MKKNLALLLLLPFVSIAQVGINTTAPKAALDVESTNNGILIPRVQLTSILDATTVVNPNAGPLEISTLVYNIAPAGTVPNNVLAGFYYWDGSQWIAIVGNSDKWSLTGNSGTNPAVIGTTFTPSENFIGTTDDEDLVFGTNNTARMNITNTGFVTIGENPFFDNNNKLRIRSNDLNVSCQRNYLFNNHLSSAALVSNPASNTFETYSQSGSTTEWTNVKMIANGSNSGTNIGLRLEAYGATNNYAMIIPQYGGRVGIGTNTPAGKLHVETINENRGITNNLIKNAGTGDSYNIENNSTINSNSVAFGIRNTFSGTGTGGKIGLYNNANETTNGTKIGVENVFQGSNSAPMYGIANNLISFGTGLIYGVHNDIASTIDGGILRGFSNFITTNSNTPTYGNHNQFNGSGDGIIHAVYSIIANSGDGEQMGVFSNLTGTGSGAKYGTNSTIASSAGGQHFGVFARVLKSGNNYAGYFNGKVAIGTNISFGIDDYVFPMARGTNGQIMQTDGAGNLSWQNPATIIGNSAWSLTGNSITAGTHFIGSTNNVDVSFRRSGTNIGYLGEYNLAFGIGALQPSVGVYNVAIGVNALAALTAADQNVAVGWNALSNVTTGGNNIGIGTGATVPVAANNNQIRMGNVNIGYAGVQVAWSVTSDSRWKDNIKTSNLGLDFINKLNPVYYTRKNDETKKTEYGFIAQELDKTLTEVGATNNGIITKDDDGMLSIRYNDLLAPMVKAIQELKTENDTLKQQKEALENRLKAIEEKLNITKS